MLQAQQLIKENRLSEARQILEKIDHATARQWIHQIDKKLDASIVDLEFPTIERKIQPVIKPKSAHEVLVTTVDLPSPYVVIAPIYFQVSNKGLFSSDLGRLKKKYQDEIQDMRRAGKMNDSRIDWGWLWYGEWSSGQNDFEAAFFVATRELQNRAFQMKADAVVGMRQDIDLDTHGWQFFYLQMYGTAVRFL